MGFGLVQIPVSLHAAEETDELSLTLLDKRDFSPVGYERINKKTGKEVKWEDTVKGYESGTGKYVVLTERDFAEANPKATHQIDILDFVELAEIDPHYIDKPYVVVPSKYGKKPYALLREVLKRSGKAGHRQARAAHSPAPVRGDPARQGAVAAGAALRRRAARHERSGVTG